MSRHSDEHQVTPDTRTKRRLTVENLRRRATFRKLLLLECAIVRLAPFANCGRPLWDLMAEQSWFQGTFYPDWTRVCRASEFPPADPGSELYQRRIVANGHDVIEWFELHADGKLDDDRLLVAEEFFRSAEWDSEAGCFEPTESQREKAYFNHGLAIWLWLSFSSGRESRHGILDGYLLNFTGRFQTYGDSSHPLHPDHQKVALSLIEDVLRRPLQSDRFDPAWRTADVVGIAHAMYESRDFSAAPILADALEDAGCDNPDALAHCRSSGPHVRGCWVVDLVLDKR